MSTNEEFSQRQPAYLTSTRQLLLTRQTRTRENFIAALVEAGVDPEAANQPESISADWLERMTGKELNGIECRYSEMMQAQLDLTYRDGQIRRLQARLQEFGKQLQ